MQDKLNQFVSNLNGQFVEVSSISAPNQCMDLAYNWVFCLNIPKATIQQGSAYQVYSNASDFTRQYFDIFQNTVEFIPQAGDLFVIGKTASYPYGHIGIVIEATQTKMKCFEQNFPTGTNSHIQDRGYTSVTGFLRAKNVTTGDTPQWMLTLLQERGLTINNESEIRTLFDKAKRYDDEVKELQEQVKSANESLSDKSLEVSTLLGKLQKVESRVSELEPLYNNAKAERDSFGWEVDKLKIKIDELEKGMVDKDKQIEQLKIDLAKSQTENIGGMTLLQLLLTYFKRK
jgi:hypothetical protein